MFGTRHLAAMLMVVAVVGACTTAAPSVAAPTNAPTAAPTATGTSAPAIETTASAMASATATTTATATATATAAGGGALGGPVARGGDMCGLLGPGDFSAAGVTGAASPTRNSDAPTDAYCVYAGISSATGGIEFDAFLGDPVGTYQEVKTNGGILQDDATGDLPGVDAAGTQLNGPGGMATIGVKSGQLTFDIGFPTNPNARAQLIALAKLVLQRGTALT
jgi:hypothetical protein